MLLLEWIEYFLIVIKIFIFDILIEESYNRILFLLN
jgi:hypothetical protein